MAGISEIETDLKKILRLDDPQGSAAEANPDLKKQRLRPKKNKSNKKYWKSGNRKKSQSIDETGNPQNSNPIEMTNSKAMSNNMQNLQVKVQISNQHNTQQFRRVRTLQTSSPMPAQRDVNTTNSKPSTVAVNPIASLCFPGQGSQFKNSQMPILNVHHQQQRFHLQTNFESYQNPNVKSKHCISSSSAQHQRAASANSVNIRQLTASSKKKAQEHQNRPVSARSHNTQMVQPSFSDSYLIPQNCEKNPNFGSSSEVTVIKDISETRKKSLKTEENINNGADNQATETKLISKKAKLKDKWEKNRLGNNSRDKKDSTKKITVETKLTPRLRQTSENDKDSGNERETPRDFNRYNQTFRDEFRQLKETNMEDLIRLKKEFIHSLSKVKLKFPWARFFCQLCDLHQSGLDDAIKHAQSKKHIINLRLKKDKQTVLKIRNPSKSHNDLLTEMIERTVEEYSMTDDDFKLRSKIAQDLEDLIRQVHPKAVIHIVGSTATKAGLKTSDLNLDIEFDDPEILIDVYELLKNNDCYTEIKLNKKCRVASVHATKDDLPLTITVAQSNTRDLTKLLRSFMMIDGRAKKLCIAFRRFVEVIDGGCLEMGMMPSFIYYIMVIFFLQQTPYPVLPIFHRKSSKSDEMEVIWDPSRAVRLGLGESQYHHLSLGELWFDLLMFYAVEFNARRFVISIRQLSDVRKYDRKWFRKVYSVEDPINPKVNLIKSLSATGFNYLQTAFYKAALYYGKKLQKFASEEPLLRPWDHGNGRKLWENTDDEMSDGEVENAKSSNKGESSKNDTYGKKQLNKTDKESIEKNEYSVKSKKLENENSSTVEDKKTEIDEVEDEENFKFVIDAKFFDLVKPAPSVCTLCDEEGHSKANCPNEELPELEELPPYNKEWDRVLTKILRKIPSLCELKDRDIKARQEVIQTLFNRISCEFKDVWLNLFGSSNNGFGFQDSDIDVCMTLKRSPVLPKTISSDFVIKRVSKVLRQCGDFKEIMDIPSAKVPIVKFTHKHTGLDGDISLYNTLALRNTKLLYFYSKIDERCRILGYTSKIFARRCDIGDASRGSLSSYAYILMVVYFLQQTEPPVLPVLQEMYDGVVAPQCVVEGCNTYFYDNLDDFISGRLWNRKNKKSVGELWLEMLKFYTETFDFSNTVICIRQKKPLSTLKKLWTGCAMAIEDPFDLSHNLGGFLTGRMRNFILQAFRRARLIFGTPLSQVPDDFDSYEEYLFSRQALYPGKERPTDRLCRKCGHVGHSSRDCKRKRQNSRSDKPPDDDDTWWRRSFTDTEEVKKEKKSVENEKVEREDTLRED